MSARRNLAILLLAGCFIRLCRTAARGDLEPLDLQTAKMVERWRGPANELMVLFSEIGEEWTMASATVLLTSSLWVARRWREGAFVGVTGAGALISSYLMRHTLRRHRPSHPYLVETPQSFSFPSGHAAGTTAVLGSVIVVLHALKAPLVLRHGALCLATALAPAVGLSRVYLGIHYPSDVLGGQLVAALWIGGAQRLLLHRAAR